MIFVSILGIGLLSLAYLGGTGWLVAKLQDFLIDNNYAVDFVLPWMLAMFFWLVVPAAAVLQLEGMSK